MPATSAPTLSSPRHALPRLARTYPLALWWGGAFLILHSALRLTLALATWHGAQLDATSLLATLGRGLVFDVVTLALIAPVLLALESLVGARHKPAGRIRLAAVYGLAGVLLYAFGFGVLAEWFFWDEFGVRFNFIAVDYLIYTHEVIGNIRESFPVGTLLSLLAAAVILAVWASRRWLAHAAMPAAARSTRIGVWVASLMLAWGAALFWSMDARQGANEYQKELSANGLYSFGYAFTHNSIDYFDFYATRPGATLAATTELPRVVAASAPRNVVIITMESLSSSYTAHGGNTKGLTPNIDRLADSGLFLANLRAAGNRTVRGLEALSLAIPPMPGHSMIWRDHNQNLETLGAVLADHGYTNRFVYGGYARFDNMDAYFSGNHYQPVDRSEFPERHRGFANIWGLADEHLYDYALELMDRDAASGKPFLMHLMTTSNHTPFTFPDGRIDLPRGRPGAVKYSDWALGRFIEAARKKPWFKDTVFVVVADHCASSKGRTSLPPENYHIPTILYSPVHIAPHSDTRLASQIDLVPSVLDLLNLPERSQFMGRSVLRAYPDEGRAFIATYQKLGYLTPDRLVILSPGRKVENWTLDSRMDMLAPAALSDAAVDRAIAFYQEAARRARDGLLRHVPFAGTPRIR